MLRNFTAAIAGALIISANAYGANNNSNGNNTSTVIVGNTTANAVPTTITNTPSVTVASPVQVTGNVGVSGTVAVSNTVPVTVQSLPPVAVPNPSVGGQVVTDVLSVELTAPGGALGTQGTVVPAGKRRIITLISANWACDTGHKALVSLFANTEIFLPGPLVLNDGFGHDFYATTITTNLVLLPGQQLQALGLGDGGHCIATIFATGQEVPDPG